MVYERDSNSLKPQCEYEAMCHKEATVTCDNQLLYCANWWSGCGKRLCDDHSDQRELPFVIGFSRCKDGACDKKMKVQLLKQLGIGIAGIILPLTLLIIIINMIFSEATFTSPFYHVERYNKG